MPKYIVPVYQKFVRFINEGMKITVESLLLFADQWRMEDADTGVEVRSNPFLDHTLPAGSVSRKAMDMSNPLVTYQQFKQANEYLATQGRP
jgi:hypothetical protein